MQTYNVQKCKMIMINLVLALVGTIIAVLTTEYLLRLRQWVKYGTTEMFASVKFEFDQDSGLKIPVAGSKTKSITVNSRGFRSPELDEPKPRSRVRIAFLGASTTFCSEVSRDEITWPHLLWNKLQKIYAPLDIDYINAAVPGYTVSNSLRNLVYRVEPLMPDIIMIYHAHNDLVSNSRKIAKEQGIYQESQSMHKFFFERMLLWNYVYTNINIFLTKMNVINNVNRLHFDLQEISKNFHKDLTALVEFSKSITDIVIIATFSYKIRREQSYDEKLSASLIAIQNMPYMSIDGLLQGYEEYNKVIHEVANNKRVILIDNEMGIPANDKTFGDSIHFNDVGSQLMAQRIVNGLSESAEFKNYFKNLQKARTQAK